MVQEVGHARLRERGIDLIAADNPGSFIDATPTAKLVRLVLGAISEFEKAMTVAKLPASASAGARASMRAGRATPSVTPDWSPWSVNCVPPQTLMQAAAL
jgi:DNA invertase Pin-like site-specific DNA recombinase